MDHSAPSILSRNQAVEMAAEAQSMQIRKRLKDLIIVQNLAIMD